MLTPFAASQIKQSNSFNRRNSPSRQHNTSSHNEPSRHYKKSKENTILEPKTPEPKIYILDPQNRVLQQAKPLPIASNFGGVPTYTLENYPKYQQPKERIYIRTPVKRIYQQEKAGEYSGYSPANLEMTEPKTSDYTRARAETSGGFIKKHTFGGTGTPTLGGSKRDSNTNQISIKNGFQYGDALSQTDKNTSKNSGFNNANNRISNSKTGFQSGGKYFSKQFGSFQKNPGSQMIDQEKEELKSRISNLEQEIHSMKLTHSPQLMSQTKSRRATDNSGMKIDSMYSNKQTRDFTGGQMGEMLMSNNTTGLQNFGGDRGDLLEESGGQKEEINNHFQNFMSGFGGKQKDLLMSGQNEDESPFMPDKPGGYTGFNEYMGGASNNNHENIINGKGEFSMKGQISLILSGFFLIITFYQ